MDDFLSDDCPLDKKRVDKRPVTVKAFIWAMFVPPNIPELSTNPNEVIGMITLNFLFVADIKESNIR